MLSLIIVLLVFSTLIRCEEDPLCIPCKDLRAYGETYDGQRDRTANGVICSPWSSSAYFPIEDDEDYHFFTEEHNKCRGYKFNNHEKYGPWCFLEFDMERNRIVWEPCFKACEDQNRTCISYNEIPFKRFDYLGKYSVSKKKHTCQKWSVVYHNFGSELKRWDHNYCRTAPLLNHSSDVPQPKVPWCHTENRIDRFEECFENCHDIATCMERLETTLPYKGKKKQTSVNGLNCDSWTNPNNSLTKDYPGTSSDQRYCRNFGLLSTGPFCLIDPAYDPDKVLIEPCFEHCEDIKIEGRQDPCVGPDKMIDYWGSRRITKNNHTCQRWDKKSPRNHSFIARHFGVNNLWEITNFCRNPDSSLDGPWCFVVDKNITREPCFEKCTGTEHDNITVEPFTITTEETIPEGGGGLGFIWQIFLFIIVVLVLMMLSDLIFRNCCMKTLKLEATLAEAETIIEDFRPGGLVQPNPTKGEIENWKKLIDDYNHLRKTKEFAVGGIA